MQSMMDEIKELKMQHQLGDSKSKDLYTRVKGNPKTQTASNLYD